MAANVWKGFISFGLVSVPIRLFSAARYSHIQFHEVHRECRHRIQQQLYCPYDERVVQRDEIVLGYGTGNDKMTIVDPKELRDLEPPSSTAMDILQFVKLNEVDPIYFETSYFSVPEEEGRRAYALLLKTMEESKLAAIAKLTIHRRERTVIIRPYGGGLLLHTIYYPSEIREVPGYRKNSAKNLKRQEISLSGQFAKGLIEPFRPDKFRDEYEARVGKLISSKSKGRAAPKPEKGKRLAPVIDLTSALRKSLESKSTSKGIKRAKVERSRKTA
ncbi:MAG: Ku protein [Terracidiphilus sp.]